MVNGFVSGIVGIGGFFQSNTFNESCYQIVTTASLFILINSISRMWSVNKENVINEILNYWPLFIVVLLGGQLGNFLNLRLFSNKFLL